VTQPLPLQFGSVQLQPSSCDQADGLQLAVLAEALVTDETRPLPHYWVSEQPQHSELDEGDMARLAVLAEVNTLVAPSITNAFDFVMRNPIVTP